MFGLPSMQKLLVLAAIIAIVWYGFRFLGRLKETREREARQRDLKDATRPAPKEQNEQLDVEETVQCAVCGAYVPTIGKSNCGKSGCPY